MASGDTLLIFEPHSAELPASASADLELVNYRPVVAFDGGSLDESVLFTGIMPFNYDGNGYRVYLTYAMAAAVAGKVVWQVDWENNIAEELGSDNFLGAPLESNPTVPGTALDKQTVFIIFTEGEADDVDDNKYFRIKITREASDTTNDTAAGDAYLLRVEIRER